MIKPNWNNGINLLAEKCEIIFVGFLILFIKLDIIRLFKRKQSTEFAIPDLAAGPPFTGVDVKADC